MVWTRHSLAAREGVGQRGLVDVFERINSDHARPRPILEVGGFARQADECAAGLLAGDDLGCLLQRLEALDQISGRKLATRAGYH